MLADKRATVDGYDFMLRESFLQGFPCHSVIGRLIVGRHEHGSVYDQKVRIRSRQALPLFIEYRLWHGQWDMPVRLILQVAEHGELFFHPGQFFVVAVVAVGTFHVSDGLIRAEAGQRVDVSVCVISLQSAV